jgi:hypothetical protein
MKFFMLHESQACRPGFSAILPVGPMGQVERLSKARRHVSHADVIWRVAALVAWLFKSSEVAKAPAADWS